MAWTPVIFGTGGGAGFTLGPPNNLFGATAGNASASPLTVSPAANRAAAEGVRDTYFGANPSNLATYDADENLNIRLFYTESSETVIIHQVRQGSAWVDNASTVGIQGIPGSGTDFTSVGEGNIPVIGAGPGFLPADSGLSIDSTTGRFVSDKSLELPSGTLFIGPSTSLSAAVRAIHLRSDVTGNRKLILAQLYDTTNGFSMPFVYRGTTVDEVTLNTPPGTDNSNTAVFDFTTTADELLTRFTLPTNQISQTLNCSLTIRTTSQSGPVAFSLSGDINSDASGNVVVDLSADYNPILVDNATTLYVNISCTGMVGTDLGGGVFRPNAVIQRIVVDRPVIALNEDIPTTLSALTNDENFIDGIVVQDEGVALTNDGTTLNFTGPGVTATGTGATKTINITGGGITVQDEGVDLATQATTLNFVGAAVAATGTGAVKTITISSTGTVPSPVTTDLRYGLSSQSDPALVDFGTLTDVPSPTDPQTVSTGLTTAGQYFHIFSSNTHDIITIRDTVLDQIVYQDGGSGNIFIKRSDVRTESTITYDAYSIGPLNAGVNEEYILRFS